VAQVALPPVEPGAPPAAPASVPVPVSSNTVSANTAAPAPDEGARAATEAAPARSEVLAGPAPSAVASAKGAAPLREELEILQAAHEAMRAGDKERALALLDAHAARFKDGSLKDERMAARAIALCAAGRDTEARAAVAEFLNEVKGSPLEQRVRAACATLMSGEPEKR
jgi:hypothetical protein